MDIQIKPLGQEKCRQTIELLLSLDLDTREEIGHHLKHLEAHCIALDGDKVVGVVGWYQDTVNYATEAMAEKFPGEDAYWVGFFGVDAANQKQGIGSQLLRHIEAVLRAKNVEELWVSSVAEAKTYYEKQGFNEVKQGIIDKRLHHFLVKRLV